MDKEQTIRRRAIIQYKLTARQYRRRKIDYREMDKARTAMCAALGYDRPYSYLGEFCNLHERDFPSYIEATRRGIYQYSGWHSPISYDEHRAVMRRDRKRALELSRLLCLSPADRFISGMHIGWDAEGEWKQAAFIGRVIYKFKVSGFCTELESHYMADEPSAAEWFLGLPNPVFQEIYGAADMIARKDAA